MNQDQDIAEQFDIFIDIHVIRDNELHENKRADVLPLLIHRRDHILNARNNQQRVSSS